MNDQQEPVEPQSELASVLEGFHRRISTLEAALPKGLMLAQELLQVHQRAILMLAMGIGEIVEGKHDPDVLAEIRRIVAEVKELEKLHGQEPPPEKPN